MATPHVSGFIAYLLGVGLEQLRDCYSTHLVSARLVSALTTVSIRDSAPPIAALDAGTPNKLLLAITVNIEGSGGFGFRFSFITGLRG